MSTSTQEQTVSTETINPVDFDNQLMALHEKAGQVQARLTGNRDFQHIAVGDRKSYVGKAHLWRRTAAEVLESLQIMAKHGQDLPASISRGGQLTARKLLDQENDLMVELSGIMLAISKMDATYALPENRWNRYFRCMNSDGHIHSSLRGCQTVNYSTAMSWNTHLSGQPVEAAIADIGPTLCSVCYPGAPVEWRQRKSDVERAAREAAKAAREEAKFVKRLRDDELFRCDHSFVETVAACLEVLRKEVEFRDYYGRGEHPFHREYWEAAHLAKAVLIAREERQPGTGRTAEQIDKTIDSAIKKNRKEGARI
jgi:hypothetical protein